MKIAIFIVATPPLFIVLVNGYFALLQRSDYGGFDSDNRMIAWILGFISVGLLWWLLLA